METTDRLDKWEEEDLTNTITALKSVRSAWLRDPAVVAIDVGYRLENGKPVDTPCHLYTTEIDGHKHRLCSEEVAEAFEVTLAKARTAITDRLGEEIEAREPDVHYETYDKPWIRVHVDRRMTPNQVETLGRHSYHHGLHFGDEWYPVAVIDALYKPLARTPTKPPTGAPSKPSGGVRDFVTHDQLQEKLDTITKKWKKLQADWAQREKELQVELKGETKNRRRADAKDRGAAHEEIEVHDQALSERIERVEDLLNEHYSLSHVDLFSAERRGRADPLSGGISIGTSTFSCGTLSTIVWDRTDCTPCLLSTWHVLAAGGAEVGTPVMQPSRMDGGTKPRDTVARLKRWELSPNVDAALAELNGTRGYAGGSILEGPARQGAVTIQGPCEIADNLLLGLPVWKFGRTSGFNTGLVDGIAMSLCIEYGDSTVQVFHDQLHIVPHPAGGRREHEVSQAGDSGAIWMTYNNEAVGLQFAGDMTNSPLGDFSVANRMSRVAEDLKFSLKPIFVHPREMEERQREAELRAEIAELKPPEVAHEKAKELVDVLGEILDSVIDRFDETAVDRAIGQIRQALGPINWPERKP